MEPRARLRSPIDMDADAPGGAFTALPLRTGRERFGRRENPGRGFSAPLDQSQPSSNNAADVGGAAFADAFSWCEVCNKHLAMGTCDAGWCAKCYTSAAQGGTMLTLAVHDTTGCECGGRGAQLGSGSLLPLAGATSSAATPPGAYARALAVAPRRRVR